MEVNSFVSVSEEDDEVGWLPPLQKKKKVAERKDWEQMP